MKTKMSSKGQIVLSASVRRRLALVPGTEMEVVVEGDRLVLTPRRSGGPRFRQGTSAASGLPVLDVPDDAARLSSDQVAELLSDFP